MLGWIAKAGSIAAAGVAGTMALGRAIAPDGEGFDPIEDIGRGAVGAFDFMRGGASEAVNIVGHHVHLPRSPQGTVYEPHGDAANAGADVTDWFGRLVGLVPDNEDPAEDRDGQPLLLQRSLRVDGAGPAMLEFDAKTRANWRKAGEESVLAAVYVDGSYISDVTLMGERDETYRVALGALPAGTHDVEVRIAEGSPIDSATAASIRSARLTRSTQPLVDRYAPILEGRDLGATGGRPDMGHNDTPLVMDTLVAPQHDGTTMIEYRVLFSNEDGGTDLAELMKSFGRSTDYEPIYRVLVDEDGERVSDSFQTTRHQWMSFDGTREGDRPVMRIDTDNNLMSARIREDGHRWSPATERASETPVSARDVMNDHSWTWKIMGRELKREGKLVTAREGVEHAESDPRRFAYVTPSPGAFAEDGTRQLHIVLDDGRELEVTEPENHARAGVIAIELPKGTDAGDVTAVRGPAREAFVVKSNFQPRDLPRIANPDPDPIDGPSAIFPTYGYPPVMPGADTPRPDESDPPQIEPTGPTTYQ